MASAIIKIHYIQSLNLSLHLSIYLSIPPSIYPSERTERIKEPVYLCLIDTVLRTIGKEVREVRVVDDLRVMGGGVTVGL